LENLAKGNINRFKVDAMSYLRQHLTTQGFDPNLLPPGMWMSELGTESD